MSKLPLISATFLIVIIVSAAIGCGSSTGPGDSAEAPQATAAEPSDGLKAALASYESARALLADDKTEGLAQAAVAIAEAARRAAVEAPQAIEVALAQLAEAADQLKQSPPDDIAAVRLSFGELSRAVVSVLTEQPALAEGLFVMECPMAEGYKKWVQRESKVSNPYMGLQMPECGVEAGLSE